MSEPAARVVRHAGPGAAFADPVELVVPGGRFVEVSGQIGFDASGTAVPEDFAEEARSCFAHVRRSLERAGASLADLIRVRAYLTDLADYPVYAAVRAEVLAGALPSSTAVGVAALLAGGRLELEATAFVPPAD